MASFDPAQLPDEVRQFLADRHLASLTLVRPNGMPHVTPVGFSWDDDAGLVRIITWNGSVKWTLLDRHGELRASVCQIDGGRWLTLEGVASATMDSERAAEGVRRYGERYQPPKDRGVDRVVIEIAIDRVMGRA